MYVDRHDMKQIEALKKLVKPEWQFIDVGACQGALMHPMSQMMNCGWGFEANPRNIPYLEGIFKKIFNVKIINMGISNKNQVDEFYIGTTSHNASISESFSREVLDGKGMENKFSIPCVTLDSFFHDVRIDIIKMDIEGGEWIALEGATNILKNQDAIWLIEFHMDDEWHKREIFYDHGYDIFDRDTFEKLDRNSDRPYQAFIAREDKMKSLVS